MEHHDKAHNWWREILGPFLGVLSGIVVFLLMCIAGLFLLVAYCQSSQSLMKSNITISGILFLVFVVPALCSFVVGNYVNTKVPRATVWSGTETAIRPSVICLLYAHVTALIAVLVLVWFLPPVFEEIFGSMGGRLPKPTMFCITVSHLMKNYWFLTFPSVVALLWGDVRVYQWLHQTGRKRSAHIWSRGIFYVILAQIPFTLWACFLPLFKIGELVNK